MAQLAQQVAVTHPFPGSNPGAPAIFYGLLEEPDCPRLPVTEKTTGLNPVGTAILEVQVSFERAGMVRHPVGSQSHEAHIR